MPIYGYNCKEHGEFEVWQKIHDKHVATCPKCAKAAERVFCPLALHGDLPSKPNILGKTRGELFDNMASEGFHDKNWREKDEVGIKQYTDKGWRQKVSVGWTPALGT